MEAASSRQTKYCVEIEKQLKNLGHATNLNLLNVLQKTFNNLSATTVHRATARLAERGIISIAPQTNSGSIRYDTNIKRHDHFKCDSCDFLIDIDIKDKITPLVCNLGNDCEITGNLTISGLCKNCKKEKI